MSPDEAGERAYALLFEALRKSGYAALARVAMHRREHVMALRPGQNGIVTHTLYYADEVRKDQEFHTDTAGVSKKELDLALLLVESLADTFEPSKYRDTYRDQVRALIETKVAGREVAEVPAPRPASQVVDILKALQQSLEQTRKPAARVEAKPRRKAAR
jgi:DNA end-binding protein Ku